jgi:esterase
MKLNYKKIGQGQPFLILHGLFGSLDNWSTISKEFAKNFEVFIIDQRNHGQSPHSEEWNYDAMADDLMVFIKDHQLKNVILLGHSMGGKTAMLFALKHPNYLDKLIIADIAPKRYPPHHNTILKSLNAVDFSVVNSRQQVEEVLGVYLSDIGTKQFLLKNLYWENLDNKKLAWRFNLPVISRNLEKILNGFDSVVEKSNVETLFLKGEASDYILPSDMPHIKSIFPNASLAIIQNAGHWLHAENPNGFVSAVNHFISSGSTVD